MPRKIAMIGAGSVVFCKTLLSDILATPALADSEFALMSPTESKLRRMEAFATRMIADNGLPAKSWATTDRRGPRHPFRGGGSARGREAGHIRAGRAPAACAL